MVRVSYQYEADLSPFYRVELEDSRRKDGSDVIGEHSPSATLKMTRSFLF